MEGNVENLVEANTITVPVVVFRDVKKNVKEASVIVEEKTIKIVLGNPIEVQGNPDHQVELERTVLQDQSSSVLDPKDQTIIDVLPVEGDNVVLAGRVNFRLNPKQVQVAKVL